MDELSDDLHFIEAADRLCFLIQMEGLVHVCFCFFLDGHGR